VQRELAGNLDIGLSVGLFDWDECKQKDLRWTCLALGFGLCLG
jgi:hypothetical protein